MNLTPNFTLREFASRGEPVPEAYMDNVIQLAQNLQKLRDRLGKVIMITSGYRTREHNTAVGGVTNSQHLYAKAADFVVQSTPNTDVYCAIEVLIAEGKMVNGGLGYYGEGDRHIHYDIGPVRRWTGEGVATPKCPPEEDEMTDEERKELASVKALVLGNNKYIRLLGQKVNLHGAQIQFLADAMRSVHPSGAVATDQVLAALAEGQAALEARIDAAAAELAGTDPALD